MEQTQNTVKTPSVKWRAFGEALLYLGVYFAVQLVVSGAALGILALRMLAASEPTGAQAFSAALMEAFAARALPISNLCNGVVLAVYALIFLLRRRSPMQEVYLVRAPLGRMLWLVPLGVSLNILIAGALSLLPETMLSAYEESAALLESTDPFSPLMIVLFSPFVEEVVFRGLLYSRLRRAVSPFIAALLSSLAFGLLHGQLVWMLYAFVVGLLLCAAFERYKTLWASVLMHVAFNLGSVFSVLLETAPIVPILLCAALVCASSAYFAFAKAPHTKSPTV